MTFAHRYPLNIPGKFYINDQCTDCDLCRECAPKNIRRDDRYGQSYVFKQPESKEELAAVMEGVEGCPTEGVCDDGDRFNWDTEPIIDWNTLLKSYNLEANFKPLVEVIPYEKTLKEEKIAMEKWRSENKKPWWKIP